jgi:hypothetical protein
MADDQIPAYQGLISVRYADESDSQDNDGASRTKSALIGSSMAREEVISDDGNDDSNESAVSSSSSSSSTTASNSSTAHWNCYSSGSEHERQQEIIRSYSQTNSHKLPYPTNITFDTTFILR